MSWRAPYPKFPGSIGLHRTKTIAASLGVDLTRFGEAGAVITGSNGKGSTAAMLASILAQTARPIGLFTSPHLIRLNERFQINGEEISDAELHHHWTSVDGAIGNWRAEGGEEVGGFEFLFLIAADWFKTRRCAATVWEAGIGGRYDPVRLIRARRTALTSLDLEHTTLLGDTLELIAYDKLDAAPAGATVYLGENCAPLRARIESYCALRDVTPVFLDGGDVTPFASPLAGAHQRSNTRLAVSLARDIMGPTITDAQVKAGLANTNWPGRLETLSTDPLTIIDVGHTPDAIAVALSAFTAMNGAKPAILVCGASHDKAADVMIGALARGFDHIICASPGHKGAPAAQIARAASAAHQEAEIVIAESVADARLLALAKAKAQGASIYVAGGLFLAAEFKAAHLGLNPATLDFF